METVVETRITNLGVIQRGSIVWVRLPNVYNDDFAHSIAKDVRENLKLSCNHNQFLVMVTRGDEGVVVEGPEGMLNVLARLSMNQLISLQSGLWQDCPGVELPPMEPGPSWDQF